MKCLIILIIKLSIFVYIIIRFVSIMTICICNCIWANGLFSWPKNNWTTKIERWKGQACL